jgi:glucosamine--fructose-6-phosphate aminotransferase (isomerizing)
MDFSQRLAALTVEPSRDVAGDASRLARVERTRVEMMGQGAAMAQTLAAEAKSIQALARRLRAQRLRRWVVAGCGDSWFVGMGVRVAVERLLRVPLEAAQALDYASYGSAAADARTLVIGISSSGNTPAVLAALQAAKQRGAFTVGISNTPGSPLLTECDAGLVVHAARKGWPTQSSSATMALLMRLAQCAANDDAAAAFGRDLDALAARLDSTALELDPVLAPIATAFAAAPLMLFAGLGPNFASACFGAAKIKELSPIHAIALPLEEYHHYRAQKQGEPLFLLATDPASHERALDTMLVSQKRGGRSVAIVAQELPEIEQRAFAVVRLPLVRPELSALLGSLPLHLLAYHFAKARDAIGLGAA